MDFQTHSPFILMVKNWFVLGLKDQNDNWIIDSNTRTSTLYFAGSRIMFERPGSLSAEKIDIIGPTTEPLKVMVIYSIFLHLRF